MHLLRSVVFFFSIVEFGFSPAHTKSSEYWRVFSSSVCLFCITPQCRRAIASTNARNNVEKSGRAWRDASKTLKYCRHSSERQAYQRCMVSFHCWLHRRVEGLESLAYAWFGVRKPRKQFTNWRAIAHWRFCRHQISTIAETSCMCWWNMRLAESLFADGFFCNWALATSHTWTGNLKKQFKLDSVLVVVNFAKIHTKSEAWTFANKHTLEAIRKWFELQPICFFLHVSQLTRLADATDSLHAIVLMPANFLISAFRASGVDGVFMRPFIESDQNRLLYRAVPFPLETALQAAVRQANLFGDKAFGVNSFARTFGVRVKQI